ncbi:ACL133Wp [Eremothecium gossypii ATCC 10895]|uniref:ACL133Wp n=1 Tax=Eremothecium gossypii (strain ATCC 10895 / CBS 109.51 / FGSC 9923 / NRRL Y-1056) TaxID=284811 RepID=Q75CQ2_EREGS|nr:ACL133Wp [Eremothecium gossypii ATCC 10895]AAS51095.1 ACL133Wp [Eremothecium gossypii ATCC 10895]AEY95385.1 FACL133Wp [Eremothecium gossypii FDAG1]
MTISSCFRQKQRTMGIELDDRRLRHLKKWLDRALDPPTTDESVTALVKDYVLQVLLECDIAAVKGRKNEFCEQMSQYLAGMVKDHSCLDGLFYQLVDLGEPPAGNSCGRQLRVLKIPADRLRWETLRAEFAPFGAVTRARIDYVHREAFLEYADAASVVRCCSVRKAFLGNRFVEVQPAREAWESLSGVDVWPPDHETTVPEHGSSGVPPRTGVVLDRGRAPRLSSSEPSSQRISFALLRQKEALLEKYQVKLSQLVSTLKAGTSQEDATYARVRLGDLRTEMQKLHITPSDLLEEKFRLLALHEPCKAISITLLPYSSNRKPPGIRPTLVSRRRPAMVSSRARKGYCVTKGYKHRKSVIPSSNLLKRSRS